MPPSICQRRRQPCGCASAPWPGSHRSVEVRVHGTPIFSSQLSNDQWMELRPVLPRMATGYHRIEVLVDPSWIPKRDGRELGVMLVWDWR